MTDRLRLVFIVNFDSFTRFQVNEFARRGAEVEVWRNTVSAEHALARALERRHSLLVLSPGPGRPADAGCCLELARRAAERRVPLFGVCLGHQAMVEAFGGVVGPAGEVLHGKISRIRHEGGALFEGVPTLFPVGRYHSLAATRLPDCLVRLAGTDRVVMAVAHRSAPQLGVQFHPESILTPDGGTIIENVIRWAEETADARE